MNCDHCQSRISSLWDAAQSVESDAVVHQHLTGCPSCRAFQDALAELDAQLMQHAAAAVLPADFKATVLAALPAPRPRLTPSEIAIRRAQLEQEYQEALAALHRRYLFTNPATLLRLFEVIAGLALAGILLTSAARALPDAVETVFGAAAGAWTVPLLCMGIGLAAALYGVRRTWRQRPAWRWSRLAS